MNRKLSSTQKSIRVSNYFALSDRIEKADLKKTIVDEKILDNSQVSKKKCKSKKKKSNKKYANTKIDRSLYEIKKLESKTMSRVLEKYAMSIYFGGLFKDLLLLVCMHFSLSDVYHMALTCKSMYFFMMSDLILRTKVRNGDFYLTLNEKFGIHNIVRTLCLEYDKVKNNEISKILLDISWTDIDATKPLNSNYNVRGYVYDYYYDSDSDSDSD